METGKVLLGVLAGIAAGAAIGILYAPEKGSDTRKKILGKKDAFQKDVNSNLDQWSERGVEKLDEVKTGIRDLAEKGLSKADELKKDLKHRNS